MYSLFVSAALHHLWTTPETIHLLDLHFIFTDFHESKRAACFHRCASDCLLCVRDVSFLTERTRRTSSSQERGIHARTSPTEAAEQMKEVNGGLGRQAEIHLEKSSLQKRDSDRAHKQHLC